MMFIVFLFFLSLSEEVASLIYGAIKNKNVDPLVKDGLTIGGVLYFFA